MKRKYTDEQLHIAVSTSYSLQETLNKLNLIGGHQRIKDKIILLKIDISHWKFQLKPKTKNKKIEEILIYGSNVQSSNLRLRLINNGILKHECKICLICEWNNLPITLQLDHINGDHNDNTLENLRLLCPNCHSQTSTYAGRNTKGKKRKKEEEYIIHKCKSCTIPLLNNKKNKRGYCANCRIGKYNGKLNKRQVNEIQINYKNKIKNINQLLEEYDISKPTFYKILKLSIDKIILE